MLLCCHQTFWKFPTSSGSRPLYYITNSAIRSSRADADLFIAEPLDQNLQFLCNTMKHMSSICKASSYEVACCSVSLFFGCQSHMVDLFNWNYERADALCTAWQMNIWLVVSGCENHNNDPKPVVHSQGISISRILRLMVECPQLQGHAAMWFWDN